ncbi:hypothetical protein BDY21DRAFT_365785 [Lineolata rhizophorae]|uniref:Uncharacterized protein n=1 Tax=Lineolata rhizophorae TaxID=578093 RepID=A0A6A6NTV6_9PEZI|nr:hypothetical protein BDY21DRAFT_365785 [Lineolata rhizophorae]
MTEIVDQELEGTLNITLEPDTYLVVGPYMYGVKEEVKLQWVEVRADGDEVQWRGIVSPPDDYDANDTTLGFHDCFTDILEEIHGEGPKIPTRYGKPYFFKLVLLSHQLGFLDAIIHWLENSLLSAMGPGFSLSFYPGRRSDGRELDVTRGLGFYLAAVEVMAQRNYVYHFERLTRAMIKYDKNDFVGIELPDASRKLPAAAVMSCLPPDIRGSLAQRKAMLQQDFLDIIRACLQPCAAGPDEHFTNHVNHVHALSALNPSQNTTLFDQIQTGVVLSKLMDRSGCYHATTLSDAMFKLEVHAGMCSNCAKTPVTDRTRPCSSIAHCRGWERVVFGPSAQGQPSTYSLEVGD